MRRYKIQLRPESSKKTMFDKKEEEEYLAIANRHIAEAEKKIDLLTRKIESLEDISALRESLDALATVREVLETLQIFRSQVLEKLKTAVAQ